MSAWNNNLSPPYERYAFSAIYLYSSLVCLAFGIALVHWLTMIIYLFISSLLFFFFSFNVFNCRLTNLNNKNDRDTKWTNEHSIGANEIISCDALMPRCHCAMLPYQYYGIGTLDIDVESCVFASSPHHFINNNEEKSKQTIEKLWNNNKHNDAASTVIWMRTNKMMKM